MTASPAQSAQLPIELPDGITVRPLTFIDNFNHTGTLVEAMRGRDIAFERLENSELTYLGARWVGLPLYYHWACTGYGAFEGRRLAGTIHVNGWRQALHVAALAVHPHYRQRGVGRTLLRLAERRARDLGRRWLSLRVTTSNEAAVRLYKSEGFRPAQHRRLSLDGSALARQADRPVSLRPLAGPSAKAAYYAYTLADLAEGDAWAADIVTAQGASRSLSRGRRRWVGRVDGQEVAYLALGGPGSVPRLHLASQPQLWGTVEEQALLGAALARLPQTPQRVKLYLASAGHHAATLRGLASLKPTDQPVVKMSMFKPLDTEASSRHL